jgi:hypothetical protein
MENSSFPLDARLPNGYADSRYDRTQTQNDIWPAEGTLRPFAARSVIAPKAGHLFLREDTV